MRRSDLAVSAIALALIAAMTIPAVKAAQDKSKTDLCANNLKNLWTVMSNYAVAFGGPSKSLPTETGEAFWLKLSKPPTVLIDPASCDRYQCPVEGTEDAGCDYRGPAANVNRYADGDPVGADVDGNHGTGSGGNVIRKSGDVEDVPADHALWKLAAQKTMGGNEPTPVRALSSGEKRARALVTIGHLVVAVWMYHERSGRFPNSLEQLVTPPKDEKQLFFEDEIFPPNGYLLEDRIPRDPWGNDYQYEIRNGHPVVWSWGADGKAGGEAQNEDLTMQDVFPSQERRCRTQVRWWSDWCRKLTSMKTLPDYPASGNRNFLEEMLNASRFLSANPDLALDPRRLNGEGELIDPWGRPYIYRNNHSDFPKNQNDPTAHNKQTFDFYSVGPDGKDEGGFGDDIGNW